jgi:hypothetical protein
MRVEAQGKPNCQDPMLHEKAPTIRPSPSDLLPPLHLPKKVENKLQVTTEAEDPRSRPHRLGSRSHFARRDRERTSRVHQISCTRATPAPRRNASLVRAHRLNAEAPRSCCTRFAPKRVTRAGARDRHRSTAPSIAPTNTEVPVSATALAAHPDKPSESLTTTSASREGGRRTTECRHNRERNSRRRVQRE